MDTIIADINIHCYGIEYVFFNIEYIYRQLEKSIDTSSLNFELQRERERVLLCKKRVGVRNVSSRLTFKLTSSQIFLGVQYISITSRRFAKNAQNHNFCCTTTIHDFNRFKLWMSEFMER